MNITIIDKEETTLIVENNTIKLSNNQQIPFFLIDTLVLNHKINLTTNTILKLTLRKKMSFKRGLIDTF